MTASLNVTADPCQKNWVLLRILWSCRYTSSMSPFLRCQPSESVGTCSRGIASAAFCTFWHAWFQAARETLTLCCTHCTRIDIIDDKTSVISHLCVACHSWTNPQYIAIHRNTSHYIAIQLHTDISYRSQDQMAKADDVSFVLTICL